MTSVTFETILSQPYFIRYRRAGVRHYLINHSEITETTADEALVFVLCDGSRSMGEVAERIWKSHAASDQFGDVSVKVLLTAIKLASQHLLHDARLPTQGPAEKIPYFPFWRAYFQCLNPQTNEAWYEGVELETQHKVVHRLLRIIYEAACGRKSVDPVSRGEFQYANEVLTTNEFRLATVFDTLNDAHPILAWRFDMNANRLVIIGDGNVYSGDVDNRL